jgi:hypothetical protein
MLHAKLALAALTSAIRFAMPAAARVCGRWTATMHGDSGSQTTMRMLVRRCGLTTLTCVTTRACGDFSC